MSKLYVPIMDGTLNDESKVKYLQYLQKAKVDTVFLAQSRDSLYIDGEKRTQYFENFSKYCRYFKENGLEVGVWIPTLGFGGEIPDRFKPIMEGEPVITGIDGVKVRDGFCPEGEKINVLCENLVKDIASYCKPDMIMIDDEFCLCIRPGLGCFCEKHMALYAKEFEKEHTKDELKELIFTGYNERYRRGWLKVVGDSLRKFATRLRRALDTVDENIRLGVCSGYTSWDMEGADSIEISKILAGKTKPFLRFSGAPYWVKNALPRFPHQKLNTVIEFVRMQESWCENEGIETFHEDDTHPRPRYYVSASMSECYDIPLLASGNMGRFKYMFCYDAQPDWELGYYKKHIKNMPLSHFIEENFNEKKTVGVRVYEEMRKFAKMRLSKDFEGARPIMATAFSPAATLLTAHSIPTQYNEEGDIAIAFGENVRYIEEFPRKLIVDRNAVEYLQEMGYTLGIKGKAQAKPPVMEKFIGGGKNGAQPQDWFFSYELDKSAKLESVFVDLDEREYPASYRIKEKGTEFLVYLFDGYRERESSSMFLSYERQKQLLSFTEEKYPYIKGTYGIYTLCKDGAGERAVLFQNMGEDEWEDFEIVLDKEYKELQLFGATGELKGNKIKISSIFLPYSAIVCILK